MPKNEYILVKPKGKDAETDISFCMGTHPSVYMKFDKKKGALKCPAHFIDFIVRSGEFELIEGETIPDPETPEPTPDESSNANDSDGGTE